MALKKFHFGLLLGLALASAGALAQGWPRIVGGNDRAECKAALRLAVQAHRSTSVLPWTPPDAVPDDFGSELVLAPRSTSVINGEVLEFDPQVFTSIPLPEYKPRSIYWQTAGVQGKRLVVEEVTQGWRGDLHRVRLVDPALSVKDYFGESPEERHTRLGKPVSDGWRSPFVFRNADGGLWLMYIAEPGGFSGNWKIILPQAAEPACEIAFRPQVRNAAMLLPQPVRHLAALLDRTLGSGKGEGEWQPTARVRASVQQAWVNAVLRPWVVDAPYNTREEVDAHLQAWAQTGKAPRRLYAAIQAQYGAAERALEQHYVRESGMQPEAAATAARSVLDTAFRMHFVLNKEDY